jgi:hypothetical protein
MARFSLSDVDRLKLAESMQAPPLAGGAPSEALQGPTKLRWRGGTLDFSKNEQIEPLSAPANKHEDRKPTERESKADPQETKPLPAIAPPAPAPFIIQWRRWGTGVGLLLTCILGLTVAVRLGSNRSAAGSIHLELRDHDGQLEIRWDPRSDLIRRTDRAKLAILDDSERLVVSLDAAQLQRGTATYARRSGQIEVRMAVPQQDGKFSEETAKFRSERALDTLRTTLATASPPPSPPAPPPTTMTTVRAPHATAPVPARVRAIATIAHPPAAKRLTVAPAEQAARTRLAQSGTSLPFTCSTGDTFRKTDAPAGWDTFICRGKNLWSLVKTRPAEESSAGKQ